LPQEALPSNRSKTLAQIAHLLKTPDGATLLQELSLAWEPTSLLGDNPEHTAYKVGQRDAYHYLLWLRDKTDG